jgi:hypothetical protein
MYSVAEEYQPLVGDHESLEDPFVSIILNVQDIYIDSVCTGWTSATLTQRNESR